MNSRRFFSGTLALTLGCIWVLTASAGIKPLTLQPQTLVIAGTEYTAQVPRGYVLELLTGKLDTPRLLTFASNGDLFIGSRSGRIYRLPPPYRRPEVLVTLDDYPHSVALRAGEILVARTGGLYRAPYLSGQQQPEAGDFTLLAALPGGSGHNSRSLAIGPDGRIYLSLGISGNCSDQYLGPGYPFARRRGGILILQEGGSKAHWQPFASGLRNPVGFDWEPGTGALFASNNGPDHWGFEQPPEYFSRLEPGSFHGMPWFQFDGRGLRRDNCIGSTPPRPADDVTLPAVTFPARSAPMGVAFIPTGAMDPELEHDAVVALHGSWGTRPFGAFVGNPATRRHPKLMLVRFADNRPWRVEDLVTGFQLPDGSRWARPVGVMVGPGGALYFTSDQGTQGLFRLRRQTPKGN